MSAETVFEEILDLETDDGPMAVLHKRSTDGGPHPAVVMFHDGPGVRDATHAFARKLALAGFDVAVPDLYHRHGRLIGITPSEIEVNPDARKQIMTMLTSLTDEGIQHDLDVAMAALDRPIDEPLGCIGFCLGARAVFRTLTRLPDRFVAGAMWHPSFLVVDGEADSPHLTAANLPGRLYIGMGEADQMMSVERTQPFLDAVAALGERVTVDIHPDADHGYTWSSAPTYNEAAANLAFARTVELFRSALS